MELCSIVSANFLLDISGKESYTLMQAALRLLGCESASNSLLNQTEWGKDMAIQVRFPDS
jgi:hypothetical protein